MARLDRGIASAVHYVPGPQPSADAGLEHAIAMLWDELYRISAALLELDARATATSEQLAKLAKLP